MKRTLIIAEAGVNHNGDIAKAKALIDKGAEAVGTDLIIALTFVFALTFLWEVIKNRVTNLEVIIGDFFFELLYLVNN